jgi:hypothetical protein
MKNIFLFLIGFMFLTVMAYATKYESSNNDAVPVVGYGYYNNGTANVLIVINVTSDGTVRVH